MASTKKGKVARSAKKTGAAIKRAAKKVTAAVTPKKPLNRGSKAARKPVARTGGSSKTAAVSQPRKVQRKSDIAPGELEAMTPSQQSSRGPFDKHRGAHLRDAEAREGVSNSNETWAEEDQATNRTGDKRIGTRGRKTY